MYFTRIKYILIDLKLFKIDLLLNQTLKYLIICVGYILAYVPFWDIIYLYIYIYITHIPKICFFVTKTIFS